MAPKWEWRLSGKWVHRDRRRLWCAGQDVYGAERRKAKTLNFSIAYGKTAIGLSKDWGVSVEARHSD